jgi:hypothetical protein
MEAVGYTIDAGQDGKIEILVYCVPLAGKIPKGRRAALCAAGRRGTLHLAERRPDVETHILVDWNCSDRGATVRVGDPE